MCASARETERGEKEERDVREREREREKERERGKEGRERIYPRAKGFNGDGKSSSIIMMMKKKATSIEVLHVRWKKVSQK